MKNAKDFLDKWRRSPKTLAGPFIQGERWAVDVSRDAVTAGGLAKSAWRALSLGKDLEKAAKRSLQIHSGPEAVRASNADAWSRLFDKRFPWER